MVTKKRAKVPKDPDGRLRELCRDAYRCLYSQRKYLDSDNSGATDFNNMAMTSLKEALKLLGMAE